MTGPELLDTVAEFKVLATEIEAHRMAMQVCGARRRDLVRRMHDAGIGYGQIAKLCGVSKGLIQNMAAL